MSRWRQARGELIIAGVFVVAMAVAGLALAGWPGLAVVATAAAAIALLTLRVLAPRPAAAASRQARESDRGAPSITGYSQRRFLVASGISSGAFYEADLRPLLEHLLAARLAERHGVNLYTEPEAARRVFIKTAADEALWRLIEPERTPPATPHGISRWTLARLIDRLEHL
ncbi:MAG TPA: hypothetical protein VMU95_26380 [Trebonia sp.]|nr:hypothetical protein [Trebonia sp.]